MVKIYTGNHPNPIGVSDIIELILVAGRKAGMDLEISNDMSGGVVIFIDEFSSA